MRKRIVEQLEKEKLLEILLEKIYYKNTVVNKIETGRSGLNPSFKKIDLVYRTTFYFERNEIYSEIQNRQYDEWDFLTLKNCSPVLTDEIIKPTEYQIKQILLKLPEDKLINIILAAKSIQDYRKYQLSERIIAYLEHYKLTSLEYLKLLKEYKGKVLAITGKRDVQADYRVLDSIEGDNVVVSSPENVNHFLKEQEEDMDILNIKKIYKKSFKKEISPNVKSTIKDWIKNI